ncbi:aldose epimerase family protein [Aquirufa sp. A-Brett2-15D]
MEIKNTKTGDYAIINPQVGASLIELHLAGLSLIDLPGSEKYPLESNPYHPSSLLTPWVNRVRNGNYSFKGKNYQLPINEPDLGNAIHGLLARASFDVEQVSENSITLIHAYSGEEPNYPFPFTFRYTYTLQDSGSLEITFEAKNTGTSSLPFACGWHPYFSFPDTSAEDLEIKFKPISRFLSDSQMIPLQEENLNGKQHFKFATEKIDHVFRLESQEKHLTEFIDTKHQRSLFLEQSSIQFPFLVVFQPEGYTSVAIEPMTANTDAFNTGDGLVELAPDEVFSGQIRLSIGK